jgi:hypothetical protein
MWATPCAGPAFSKTLQAVPGLARPLMEAPAAGEAANSGGAATLTAPQAMGRRRAPPSAAPCCAARGSAAGLRKPLVGGGLPAPALPPSTVPKAPHQPRHASPPPAESQAAGAGASGPPAGQPRAAVACHAGRRPPHAICRGAATRARAAVAAPPTAARPQARQADTRASRRHATARAATQRSAKGTRQRTPRLPRRLSAGRRRPAAAGRVPAASRGHIKCSESLMRGSALAGARPISHPALRVQGSPCNHCSRPAAGGGAPRGGGCGGAPGQAAAGGGAGRGTHRRGRNSAARGRGVLRPRRTLVCTRSEV